MSHNLDEGLAFVRALGVEVRYVGPGGPCATYDRFNRIAYVRQTMCRDGQRALDALLERIS